MPDLRDRFSSLGSDVEGLPRPSPSDVRRAAERRRTAVRAVGVAACVVAAGGVLAVSQRGGRPPADHLVESPSASAPATTAAPSPLPRAWLPAPWTLVSADESTWMPGTPSRFRFCGRAETYWEPVAVAEQVLAHPSGQRAHLVRLTPRTPDPIQLFKATYADCLVPGRAEGIGGPRNVWSYGAVAGASEPVGASLHIAELAGPAGGPPATRDQATSALDAWVK